MRTRLGRICAVCLIVLGLSPFTAPFSTCDVSLLFAAESTPHHGVALVPGELPNAVLGNVAYDAAPASFNVLAPLSVAIQPVSLVPQVSRPPLLQTVLRV
jgi:hypothetical protein